MYPPTPARAASTARHAPPHTSSVTQHRMRALRPRDALWDTVTVPFASRLAMARRMRSTSDDGALRLPAPSVCALSRRFFHFVWWGVPCLAVAERAAETTAGLAELGTLL